MAARVTIKDVAKRTGLSVGTISNFINGKPVSQKNRAVIGEAISALGFRVNKFARGLRTSASKTIALLTSDFDTVYFSAITASLEKHLMQKGYGMLISHYGNSLESLKERLSYLLEENTDGFVFMPRIELDEVATRQLQEFNDYGVPVVVLNGIVPGVDTDTVSADFEKVMFEACEEFFKHGHTKIAMITSSKIFSYENRIKGYKKAHIENGIPLDESLICIGNPLKAESYELVKALLQERPDVKAILAGGYKHTLGAMRAIVESGYTVGEDISLIGVGCEDIADIYPKSIAYIDMAVSETARTVASLLFKRIAGDCEDFPLNTMVTPRLIKGRSVTKLY